MRGGDPAELCLAAFVCDEGSPMDGRPRRRGSKSRRIHMLRHACGFKLANDGVDTRALQAYLGHKSIQHTVRYTELAPTRFKGFWRDS